MLTRDKSKPVMICHTIIFLFGHSFSGSLTETSKSNFLYLFDNHLYLDLSRLVIVDPSTVSQGQLVEFICVFRLCLKIII